jgi:hypothetical protein
LPDCHVPSPKSGIEWPDESFTDGRPRDGACGAAAAIVALLIGAGVRVGGQEDPGPGHDDVARVKRLPSAGFNAEMEEYLTTRPAVSIRSLARKKGDESFALGDPSARAPPTP